MDGLLEQSYEKLEEISRSGWLEQRSGDLATWMSRLFDARDDLDEDEEEDDDAWPVNELSPGEDSSHDPDDEVEADPVYVDGEVCVSLVKQAVADAVEASMDEMPGAAPGQVRAAWRRAWMESDVRERMVRAGLLDEDDGFGGEA